MTFLDFFVLIYFAESLAVYVCTCESIEKKHGLWWRYRDPRMLNQTSGTQRGSHAVISRGSSLKMHFLVLILHFYTVELTLYENRGRRKYNWENKFREWREKLLLLILFCLLLNSLFSFSIFLLYLFFLFSLSITFFFLPIFSFISFSFLLLLLLHLFIYFFLIFFFILPLFFSFPFFSPIVSFQVSKICKLYLTHLN